MSREIETIASRLDWLLKNHLKSDGTPHTYREIEEITAEQGYRVDAGTIGRLRNAQLKYPGLLKVRALARAFGLTDPRLLYDDEEFSQADLEAAARASLLDDPAVHEIAFRSATTLSDEQREAILQMLRVIARTEDAEDNKSQDDT